MTTLFEHSYDTIAQFIGAPSRASIALYRNTTEAINAVMYSLLSEFRDGDNVVTTMLEHNSNYVPWYGMCREILPRFGRRVESGWPGSTRSPVSWTWLIWPRWSMRAPSWCAVLARRTSSAPVSCSPRFAPWPTPAGTRSPPASARSFLLVDGAQLVPGWSVDVQALGVDYLAFSFHKMLAPFGVGVLYGKRDLPGVARRSCTAGT